MDAYRKIVELVDGGSPLAAVVVLSATGSTPQRAGARAVIDATGRLWGTVGGGPVEAETVRLAVEACRSGATRILEFQLNGPDAAEQGAICGGDMRILVDPTVARHRACFVQAAEARANRLRGCLLTTVCRSPETHVTMEWFPEAALPFATAFPGGEAMKACLANARAELLVTPANTSAGPGEVFLEPVVPPPLLIIAGGGHVGQAVAAEAVRVGFEVTVIDDRREFAAATRFPPEVNVVCGPIPQQLAACPLDGDSYVVLVTRGHRHDAESLAACIRRPLAYLGMIGSRRKVAMLREQFVERGLATAEQFDRVRAPIGLEIGAVTVPEIAVSIVAQLIAVRRRAVLG